MTFSTSHSAWHVIQCHRSSSRNTTNELLKFQHLIYNGWKRPTVRSWLLLAGILSTVISRTPWRVLGLAPMQCGARREWCSWTNRIMRSGQSWAIDWNTTINHRVLLSLAGIIIRLPHYIIFNIFTYIHIHASGITLTVYIYIINCSAKENFNLPCT